MTTSNRSGVALVVAMTIATATMLGSENRASAQSASDLATARGIYKEARELRDRGDAKGALAKFKAAHALAGTPITALELGRTYAATGQPVEAVETWLSVARMKVDPKESANAKAARAEAASLAEQTGPKIPSLTLKIEGAPSGTSPVVTVDGASVPIEALGLPRKVNPGEHVVEARVSGLPDQNRNVTLNESEAQTVTITFADAAPVAVVPSPEPKAEPIAKAPPSEHVPPSSPPLPPPAKVRGTSPLVYVGFGVGAAGVVLGSIAGIVTFSEKGKIDKLCAGLSCDPSAKSLVSGARTWATVSTVGFIVGGVGVAAGIAGLLMPTKVASVGGVSARFYFDPTYAGVEGRF